MPAPPSSLVAWTLLELRDSAALPVILRPVQQTVDLFVPDTDLLEEVVLVTTIRRIGPPEMVSTIALSLLSELDNTARVRALNIYFTTSYRWTRPQPPTFSPRSN